MCNQKKREIETAISKIRVCYSDSSLKETLSQLTLKFWKCLL